MTPAVGFLEQGKVRVAEHVDSVIEYPVLYVVAALSFRVGFFAGAGVVGGVFAVTGIDDMELPDAAVHAETKSVVVHEQHCSATCVQGSGKQRFRMIRGEVVLFVAAIVGAEGEFVASAQVDGAEPLHYRGCDSRFKHVGVVRVQEKAAAKVVAGPVLGTFDALSLGPEEMEEAYVESEIGTDDVVVDIVLFWVGGCAFGFSGYVAGVAGRKRRPDGKNARSSGRDLFCGQCVGYQTGWRNDEVVGEGYSREQKHQ